MNHPDEIAARLREIQGRLRGCTNTPTTPCWERDGVQHGGYSAMRARDWCKNCTIMFLLDLLVSRAIEVTTTEKEHDVPTRSAESMDPLASVSTRPPTGKG
jgi:hypothetical protein